MPSAAAGRQRLAGYAVGRFSTKATSVGLQWTTNAALGVDRHGDDDQHHSRTFLQPALSPEPLLCVWRADWPEQDRHAVVLQPS